MCVRLNECTTTKEFERKWEKEIRIIKKDDQKKFEDYTFTSNDNIELKKIRNESNSKLSPSSYSNDKKYRENIFKLRNNPKKSMKSHDKSRLVGGHGTQSHSPVYE